MKRFLVVFLLLVLLSCAPSTALAQTLQYSNVIDDLRCDNAFVLSDYPVISDDHSLSVIQIGESVDDELFVYVYQPSGTLLATSINIAQSSEPNVEDTRNYKLKLLSRAETLFKYKVIGLTLKSDKIRYYELTSIFRSFNSDFDIASDNNNTIGEVSYEIGQCWVVESINGNVVYSMQTVETIKIKNPYVGFLRYPGGYVFFNQDCDSYFVAFDTDKPIDKLLEASVYFVSNKRIEMNKWNILKFDYELVYEDDVSSENQVDLKYDEVKEFEGGGILGKKYAWNRISTTKDFISSEKDLTTETIMGLAGKKWILRFADFSYNFSGVPGKEYTLVTTNVSNVTILRLKFETDGKVYNLGTVMNKISGDKIPGNKTGLKWYVYLLIVVVVLIVIAVFCRPLSTILVCIVTAPFKFIKWIVDKLRGQR